MRRFLLCYLRPWSQPELRSVEEIRGDLHGSLVRRRELAEKIVEEGEVRAELASMLDALMEEFERRVKVARSGPGLVEDTHAEICQKCWSGDSYPWYGPSPADVSLNLQQSHHRLIVRRDSLDAVHQRVCSLQDEFQAAVKRENLDLQFGREQLDAELFLPTELLETINQVQYSISSVYVEPDVVDWDARIEAAHRKFRASSVRIHQAVDQFDELLIEPMREKHRNICVLPPQVSDVVPDEHADDAPYGLRLQVHSTYRKATFGLQLTADSQKVISAVEYATAVVSIVSLVAYATASVSVTAPVESAAASASAVVDRDAAAASVQNAIDDADVILDVALEADGLNQVTSVYINE